jgi:hypothetical protein
MAQGILNFHTVPHAFNQTGGFQLLQMLGQCRLGDLKAVLHVGYIAAASAPEAFDDAEADRMGQGFQNFSILFELFKIFFHQMIPP